MRADLVLTTYTLLSAVDFTLRQADVLAASEASASGSAAWRRKGGGDRPVRAEDGNPLNPSAHTPQLASLLHMRPWARVVFDEADRHLARANTKRSRAAATLLALRRWGLVGFGESGRSAVLESVLRCCC